MKAFMDKDFLLETETAKKLFHDFAEKLPIMDYHCHISPKEIATDRRFDNITQVWLGGDHYKWRFMRSCGVEEKYITGDASDYDKFKAWAKCLGTAVGNPLFHWSHLELQRYFGYNGVLSEKTADEVWKLCNEKLADPSMSAKNLIRNSNVTVVCTTDDPVDSLEWHKEIAKDASFGVKVLPAWRPDKAMNLEKPDYKDYLNTLAEAAGVEKITTFAKLKNALSIRMKYFAENGCTLSDHGLEYIMYAPATEDELEAIFLKRMNQIPLTTLELDQFKTAFMLFVGREYHKLDWTWQLHFGCKRDNNTKMFERIGVDTGFDCIGTITPAANIANLLDALCQTDELPRTILYSLNPHDNQALCTIMGCFQDSAAVGKIQHGSAWWFNDNKQGMIDQLTSLANLGNLAGFVGMLTDSRSFLSYTRHEYFRRILCNMLGGWVENGEYPADMDLLKQIVEGVSYYNAEKYFKFK